MNSNLLAIIRVVLSGFGAFLLGKNLFGATIDEVIWQMIVGVVMIIISLVMTIVNKTSGIEMIEGLVRQLLTALGGLLTGLGIVQEEAYQSISGIIAIVLPYILSLLGKKKSQDVATGELPLKALTGVKEIAKTEDISVVINIPKK